VNTAHTVEERSPRWLHLSKNKRQQQGGILICWRKQGCCDCWNHFEKFVTVPWNVQLFIFADIFRVESLKHFEELATVYEMFSRSSLQMFCMLKLRLLQFTTWSVAFCRWCALWMLKWKKSLLQFMKCSVVHLCSLFGFWMLKSI